MPWGGRGHSGTSGARSGARCAAAGTAARAGRSFVGSLGVIESRGELRATRCEGAAAKWGRAWRPPPLGAQLRPRGRLFSANVYAWSELKIRSRKFDGRCAETQVLQPRHRWAGRIKGGCARCSLLFEIWETSLKLTNRPQVIHNHDDLERPQAIEPVYRDPRE